MFGYFKRRKEKRDKLEAIIRKKERDSVNKILKNNENVMFECLDLILKLHKVDFIKNNPKPFKAGSKIVIDVYAA